ncbi:MAG: helix-turn-helix domain-containing protein [Pseudomonadota bacterium]
MKWEEVGGEQCSIARASAVLGDRWTLLILSDVFLGVRRFEDFQDRLRISRTTLTNRLKTLMAHGVLERRAYCSMPTRYEYWLTEKGADLYPVMATLAKWGDDHYADGAGPPILRQHTVCGQDFDPVVVCSECGEVPDLSTTRVRKRPERDGYPSVRRGPLTYEEASDAEAATKVMAE